MLAIRLQRTGRKGHAQFRMLVQDSRRTPTSGSFVAWLGSYDPHSKVLAIDKDKASYYLEHGAQPSERVARLLNADGIKLPDWVKIDTSKKASLRNPEKLRKNQPAEEKVETKVEEPAAEPEAETEAPVEETPVETEAPAAEVVEEKPAE